MDSAFKIAKETGYKNKIVTLEGEVLNSGGALTGGSIKGKTRNILGRKREIEDLEKEISKLKSTLLDLNKQLEIDESNRKSLDEEILNITDKIHSIKVEMATSKNEYSNIIQEKEKIEKSKEINTYKLSNIDKEIK